MHSIRCQSHPMAHWNCQALKNKGFTLLEVLVAMVIVSLGILAVFGQINQSVAGASHLRSKTLAHWIAIDRITEIRLKQAYPGVSERSDEIEMANMLWRYTIKISEVPDLPVGKLRQIDVSVAYEDTPDSILATATGFIAPPGSATATATGGWPPIDPNNTPGVTN